MSRPAPKLRAVEAQHTDPAAWRDEVCSLLRAILERLPARAPDDVAKFRQFLGAFEDDRVWTAKDLITTPVRPENAKLRAAVGSITAGSEENEGVRLLARFLARNAGYSANGKLLEHLRRNRYGEVYRVVQVTQ